jgi:GDP/UDP-N,N'-diacetylbacillosamine 2-epimerase (hydrolysing)
VRVAVITTSRADYGIYQSLLSALAADPAVSYGLVVSGTHLSKEHGYTVQNIERDGHPIWGRVESVPEKDTPLAVAEVTGRAMTGFAACWANLALDLDVVVCLGDRYEMFAAVAATVPFNLPVAHLHGGETTLGAIDDKYRHAITAMSTLHFTATEEYAQRVAGIVGDITEVYAVGAPSLDGVAGLDFPSKEDMLAQFGTDFSRPSILVTLHPETVNLNANEGMTDEVVEALSELASRFLVVITMPNADTQGMVIRKAFALLAEKNPNVLTLENFGKLGYFAAMKYCSFLLGNTSSGLLEAPSFGKFAINVGRRQEGRARSGNVIDVPAKASAIFAAVAEVEKQNLSYIGTNVYVRSDNAAGEILNHLRAWYQARPTKLAIMLSGADRRSQPRSALQVKK